MNLYGITIGPILETMSLARNTRELWAGSYLFSYLMKSFLQQLKAQGATILLPYSEDEIDNNGERIALFDAKYEAGIFPDRCVFTSADAPEQVARWVQKVKQTLIGQIISHTKQHDPAYDEHGSHVYFQSYLRVYLVHKRLDADNLPPVRRQVKIMFEALDVAELQPPVVGKEPEPYLKQFLTCASLKAQDHSFLVEDARAIQDGRLRFESLIELAAAELFTDEHSAMLLMEDGENLIIKKLKAEHPGKFKTYHKYVAIVHIDGDNFGGIIHELNDDQYRTFSEALTRYSLLISNAIGAYGGLPVYIGGDDALFFAPLKNGNKTLLDLLDEVDALFEKEFGSFIKMAKEQNALQPSISVGVSITYYRSPMYEALEESRRQLFGLAKHSQRQNGITKNAIAFQVQKHSGQKFGGILFKESESYQQFREMLAFEMEEEKFLSSVIHFVSAQQTILEHIGHQKDRVAHFIANQFNEPVHQDHSFLTRLKALIPSVYSTYAEGKADGFERYWMRATMLYGMLRLIKFLNREEND